MSAALLDAIRVASRRLVREFGFMRPTLAGSDLSPSSVHALVEIGSRGAMTAAELSEVLQLEKSSVSRMLRKFIAHGQLCAGVSPRDGRSKTLTLTRKGRDTLAAIDAYARAQVAGALEKLPADAQGKVLHGLSNYADALEAYRRGSVAPVPAVSIESGYRPGAIGRTVEMHASYYSRTVGFGAFFESNVAAGMAEFVSRLDHPRNQIWLALEDGNIIGTIAIDGEDLAVGRAHLRWFIVEDGRRGGGVGKTLLAAALAFCDRAGFAETGLWTFSGLDAARRLYEAAGFVLTEESTGTQWGKEMTEQCFIRAGGNVAPNEP
ncbi:helix-turn-helix domain-containing GNAT family N-acetyltransferase [Sodalis sp. dw_96]|uniref:bifunctional helix-turn-helix transcriptional regulator/GNAT family N-acetyltransferase n=1 Tax=Sodalis sp. dw_96 TaxID=2719794 RepID=UPI001BD1C625|nr:helix-turn-helix domain-containing GNAT family N-acetyltransferase [Sodalis sp. dw_96]